MTKDAKTTDAEPVQKVPRVVEPTSGGGQQGLGAAAAEVKDRAKGKKKGRPSKADQEQATKLKATADIAAKFLAKSVVMPCQRMADNYDRFLPEIGMSPPATFALSDLEVGVTEEAFKAAIEMLPDDWLVWLGPWVGLGVVVFGISGPRVMWAYKLRAHFKAKAEADAAKKGQSRNGGGDAR